LFDVLRASSRQQLHQLHTFSGFADEAMPDIAKYFG
jgi:hypothetical protein